jgi:hypothetical protein
MYRGTPPSLFGDADHAFGAGRHQRPVNALEGVAPVFKEPSGILWNFQKLYGQVRKHGEAEG